MTYAIVNVMYGVPLAGSSPSYERPDELSDWIEDEAVGDVRDCGVHTFYSGCSDIVPAAWGVPLKSFNECVHHTDGVDKLTAVPEDVKARVDHAYANLDPDARKMLEPFGQPRVFFLWSTS